MKKNYFLPQLVWYYCYRYRTVLSDNIGMAGAGARAGIRDKGRAGVGVENK